MNYNIFIKCKEKSSVQNLNLIYIFLKRFNKLLKSQREIIIVFFNITSHNNYSDLARLV